MFLITLGLSLGRAAIRPRLASPQLTSRAGVTLTRSDSVDLTTQDAS